MNRGPGRAQVFALCVVPLAFPLAQLGKGSLPLPMMPAVTAAAIGLVLGLRLAGRLPLLPRSPLMLALSLLVSSSLVSTLFAADPRAALRLDGDYLLGLGLAGATTLVVVDRRAARLLIGSVCLVGTGLCADGLLTAAPLKAHYGGSLVENRATGLFVQPNELGALAAIVVILSLGLLLSTERRRPLWWFAGACLVCSVGAVLITLSRGAWLGVAGGLVVLLVLAPSTRRPVLSALGVLIGLTASILVLQPGSSVVSIIADRAASFVDGQRNPYDDRPQIWAEALRQLSDHPWFGSAAGGYPVVAGRAPSTVIWVAPDHAHNLFLTVATEQGVVGVAALGGVVLVAMSGIARALARLRWHRPAADGDRVLLAGVVAALAVVLGQGILDYPLRNAVLATLVWLLLGLLAALLTARQPGGHPPPVYRSPTVPRGVIMTARHPFSVHRRPAIVSFLAAAGAFAAALVLIQVWPTTYQASTVITFTPRPDTVASADFVHLLGEKYVVIAASATVMQSVGDALGIDPDVLSDSTTVTLSAGTGNVEIAVERPDRAAAVSAANAVADTVVRRTANDALTTAEVTSPAIASRATAKPPRQLMAAVGLTASVLLGASVWAVWTGRLRARGRVAGPEEQLPPSPSPQRPTATHVPAPAVGERGPDRTMT